MKKLIALIAVVMLVMFSVFAADTDPVSNVSGSTYLTTLTGSSDVYLKTVIDPRASAGWLMTAMTAVPKEGDLEIYKEINATNNDLVSENYTGSVLEFTKTALEYTVYPTVIANFDKTVITLAFAATPLKYDATNGSTYYIPYSIDTTVKGASSAVTTNVTSATKDNFASFATTGSGIDFNYAAMRFYTTVAALDSVTAGTYTSTITMTVTSAN